MLYVWMGGWARWVQEAVFRMQRCEVSIYVEDVAVVWSDFPLSSIQ